MLDLVLDFTGLLIITQRMQVLGEVGGRGQGVGVVVAQDPAFAGEGVLVQGAGLLVVPQRMQVPGEGFAAIPWSSAGSRRSPAKRNVE